MAYIDRFGVMAVLGRQVLSYNEIQRMILSENIINSYRSRQAAENRGKWAEENSNADDMLNKLEIMIYADRDS